MKVWLDDKRPTPRGWWGVKTIKPIKLWLDAGRVTHLSLDHDLGLDINRVDILTGYELVLWMAEHNLWPSEWIGIHSDNPVGCENMAAMIDHYSPFDRIGKSFKFKKGETV